MGGWAKLSWPCRLFGQICTNTRAEGLSKIFRWHGRDKKLVRGTALASRVNASKKFKMLQNCKT